MLVSKTLEGPNGTVKFEGELEQNELDLVIKVGLNYLLGMGALPFTTKKGEDVDMLVIDTSEHPEQ